MSDPLLYIGVDLAIKRDTAAVVGIYHDYDQHQYCLWGHRIFPPPINLVTQVEPLLLKLLTTQRVGAMGYDPYQFAATQQKLIEAGHGGKLVEINQQTLMVPAANTLHGHLSDPGTLKLYTDPDPHSHFSWCAAEHTERGWRIVKRHQAKPVDFVVALAMALMVATGETGHTLHPALSNAQQGRSVLVLP